MNAVTPKTKSQEAAADVASLLRARNPLVWVVTREEARVERYLVEAAMAAGYTPTMWDVAQGASDVLGKKMAFGDTDPRGMLEAIGGRATGGGARGVWIMRDLPAWLSGPGGITTLRTLRNLARTLPGIPRENGQAVIVISPVGDVPPELSGHATVIEWPLPDRAEIAAIYDAAIASLPVEYRTGAAPNGTRDEAIDAAVGLSGEEAAASYARSLVQSKTIDPAAVAKEKRRVIARERILEWIDPLSGGLEAVGGLENLKAWLLLRAAAYSPAARAYGLPMPKGSLFAGVPGCGKSMTAKAIASAWGVPLLRLDLGSIKSKYVGESEGNLRRAFRVIEAIGRCVVWIDEIEKSLQGATSGSADGGVSSDALGAVLSWMQERTSQAFVIATANDVEALPPELLRKGRFDEIWWVDLPNEQEREEILRATLVTHGRGKDQIGVNFRYVTGELCEGFTGSEVASLVSTALYAAFADDAREITGRDIAEAAASVYPLSKTAGEKIKKLRDWAASRARPATAVTTKDASSGNRQIDI